MAAVSHAWHDRNDGPRQAAPAQLGLKFRQGHGGRLFDLLEEEIGLFLDTARASVAALRLG